MREIKTYLSLEYKNTEGDNPRYKLHAFLYIPPGQNIDIDNLEIVRDPIDPIKDRIRLDGTRLKCSRFLIKLKMGNGPTGIVHFESKEFTQDPGINHVWVRTTGHPSVNPNQGAVGNYDDPDG